MPVKSTIRRMRDLLELAEGRLGVEAGGGGGRKGGRGGGGGEGEPGLVEQLSREEQDELGAMLVLRERGEASEEEVMLLAKELALRVRRRRLSGRGGEA